MPWDRWFGSDNDGTAESIAKMRDRQRTRVKTAEQVG